MESTSEIKILPEIHCEIISHKAHRYETVGDYWEEQKGHSGMGFWPHWEFRVSKMGNPDYEFLVLIHELVEWHLTQRRGITEPVIKQFDEKYEAERTEGKHPPDAEPGDDPQAPYRKEHITATNIERLLAAECGVDWVEYEKTIMSL